MTSGTDEPNAQSRAAKIYAGIALPLAFALFFAPIPASDLSARVHTIEQSRAPIAIVGPSTVDYVSHCDADQRNLATMLGDSRHSGVLDLSEGGQPMNRSVGFAAVAGARSEARDIVLPLTYRGLDDLAAPGYREYVYFRYLEPSVDLLRGADARALWSGLNGRLGRQFEAFTFEGVKYPDYWKLLGGWFKRESAEKSCPETTAVDAAMTRAYYWWTHAMAEPNPRLIDMITDLKTDLARHDRRLHLVLMPTNFELIGELDPAWVAPMRRRHTEYVEAIRAKGLEVLDLSEILVSNEFSTRWCACAHLTDAGRAKVVARLTAFMDEPRLASARLRETLR